jgi:hypothetical protein
MLTLGHLKAARRRNTNRLARFVGVERGKRLADRLHAKIQADRLIAAPVMTLPAAPWGREAER